jgi:ABC-type dipeptide/oligopeptide/nickel transport system permease component
VTTHLKFLAGRLLLSLPVLLGVTVVVFALLHLVPGDPAQVALGTRATPEAVDALRERWGLNEPLPLQYLLFLGRVVTGDFGTSLRFGETTLSLILAALPPTLWLVIGSIVVASVISIPLALWAASRPEGLRDRTVRIVTVIGLGIPGFWLGLMLIDLVAIDWGLLPAGGFGDSVGEHIVAIILPSITIGVGLMPLIVRSLRAELLRVSRAEFVTTARSKGISSGRIRIRHVLRNALAPSVAILTINLSFLIGGTVVIEQVFGIGGLGSLMIGAIGYRDIPLVQAITLLLAVGVVLVNVAGDVVQAVLDPRVELS